MSDRSGSMEQPLSAEAALYEVSNIAEYLRSSGMVLFSQRSGQQSRVLCSLGDQGRSLNISIMATTGEKVVVPFFKKKGKGRPTTSRKRSASPTRDISTHSGPASSSKSEVIVPSRKATYNLLSAGTKRTSSQRDGLDGIDAPEIDGPEVKWTAAGSHLHAALDILAGDEAEELLAKRRRKEKADAGEDDEEVPDDGQYHGQSAYRSHIKKSTEVPKALRVGPQRTTTTIRTVTIVDYQPDVCKDYKGKLLLRLIRNMSLRILFRDRLLWFR